MQACSTITFWLLGKPLAQRAPRMMYPASRSAPCPSGLRLPGLLIMLSASASALCLSLLGMPSGSLRARSSKFVKHACTSVSTAHQSMA